MSKLIGVECVVVDIARNTVKYKGKTISDAHSYFDAARQKTADRYNHEKFVYYLHSRHSNILHDMQPSHITRLIYIATYLSYDGMLITNSYTPMNKDDVEKLMCISKRSFYIFWKDMIQREIFIEKDDGIYLNEDIFFRGKLTNKKAYHRLVDNTIATRLYVTGIRKLYERSNPRSHKTLSYIFQILPYVNKQYNIICKNPLEEDYDLIEPMTLGEFADVIGYNKKNVGRLANLLLEPTFDIQEDEDVTAIRYVITKSLKKESMMMFINPRVYYAGDYADKVKALGVFK